MSAHPIGMYGDYRVAHTYGCSRAAVRAYWWVAGKEHFDNKIPQWVVSMDSAIQHTNLTFRERGHVWRSLGPILKRVVGLCYWLPALRPAILRAFLAADLTRARELLLRGETLARSLPLKDTPWLRRVPDPPASPAAYDGRWIVDLKGSGRLGYSSSWWATNLMVCRVVLPWYPVLPRWDNVRSLIQGAQSDVLWARLAWRGLYLTPPDELPERLRILRTLARMGGSHRAFALNIAGARPAATITLRDAAHYRAVRSQLGFRGHALPTRPRHPGAAR